MSAYESEYGILMRAYEIEMQADFTPNHIIIDYESAAIKALEEVFPTAAISGCLFHFSQAVLRKVATLGQRSQYLLDQEFRITIRSLIAMAFIPITDVRARFAYKIILL